MQVISVIQKFLKKKFLTFWAHLIILKYIVLNILYKICIIFYKIYIRFKYIFYDLCLNLALYYAFVLIWNACDTSTGKYNYSYCKHDTSGALNALNLDLYFDRNSFWTANDKGFKYHHQWKQLKSVVSQYWCMK